MSYNFISEVEKIAFQDVGRLRTKFTISCGLLMIEHATDKMIWVEQKAREDLPPGIMGIPKGSLSYLDKSFLQCALREFKEETCISDINANNINFLAVIRNKPNNRLLYIFTTIINKLPTSLKEGDEIKKIYTITPNELAQIDRNKMPKELRQLAKFIQMIAQF
jgi:8-oxo-dGTP pyrophosphatase MutT (NUDIX family)